MKFISRIKEMGYLVKLDTNGYNPTRLKEILDTGMIDYVAMDIKNSKERYSETIGLNADIFRIEKIEQSVDLLMHGDVEYEFRTTMMKELHTKEDMQKIAEWIKGCKHYYLQQYMDSGNIIQPRFHPLSSEEMVEMAEIVRKEIPNVILRGVKE